MHGFSVFVHTTIIIITMYILLLLMCHLFTIARRIDPWLCSIAALVRNRGQKQHFLLYFIQIIHSSYANSGNHRYVLYIKFMYVRMYNINIYSELHNMFQKAMLRGNKQYFSLQGSYI